MRAWHRGTLRTVSETSASQIAAELAAAAVDRRLAPTPESLKSWRSTADLLHDLARFLSTTNPELLRWSYFLEFEVPRRNRRVDIAILADDVVFLVECKVGSTRFERSAIWQAEQYALDMRDFHEGCRGRVVVPMLVATDAVAGSAAAMPFASHGPYSTQCVAWQDFPAAIHGA